jgi:hypothetical protein
MPLSWPGVPCRFMHERAPTHAVASVGRGRQEAYGRTPCTQLAHFEHQSRVPSYIRSYLSDSAAEAAAGDRHGMSRGTEQAANLLPSIVTAIPRM